MMRLREATRALAKRRRITRVDMMFRQRCTAKVIFILGKHIVKFVQEFVERDLIPRVGKCLPPVLIVQFANMLR